ncbi:MAG: ACT domain-containing protein [Ilumatobacter sp.]|nr:ACT domain-containing protein [Ilumatobacter sp.]
MAALVLTLIGDDRAGLVSSVASAITEHGGNWDRSQMAELGGKFAGIVLVTVPDDRVDGLTAALEPLHGLLDVTVQRAVETSDDPATARWSLELLGADRPGIVSEITGALAACGVSIDALTTGTREAPMAGERLFEAVADLDVPSDVDVATLRHSLEDLAHELMVDIDLDPLA